MWGFIHVTYLIGWGNRLGTVYTWARAGYEVAGQRTLIRSVQPCTEPEDTSATPGRDRVD